MPRSLLRILAEIHDRPWAITARALETIVEIVERPVDLDAVAAKLGRPLDNSGGSGTEIRNGVAVLEVEGPLFRYANLFTEISGATSVEMLARDFQAALDNPQVRSILLNVNSPGGQVDGIQELADQIREGAKIKPVIAYVDGLAASGGYWVAAAAPRVVAAESALLGSIGVVASLTDSRGAQEKTGVRRYEIVSSKSPYKRPDPATDEGRAQILEMVDALAEIFLGRVAAFRGVSTETVEQNFGQGKTLVARRAVAAGMADEIGSFEPLVARLAAEEAPRAPSIVIQEDITMADNPTPPAATPPPVAQTNPAPLPSPATERERIAAILNAPEAAGREQLARVLALETDMSPEGARRLLNASPTAAAGTPPENPLAAQMAQLRNPAVGVRGTETEDTSAQEAARILAFVPKERRLA